MKIRLAVLLLFFAAFAEAQKAGVYYPPPGSWEHRPAQLYFDTAKLSEAVRHAIRSEAKAPRSMEKMQAQSFGREPFGYGVGPFSDRGDATGLIILHGYVVAQWGSPDQVEMTHSVTKSFLSTVAGLARDEGLIRSVKDTVFSYVPFVEWYQPVAIRDSTPWNQSQLIYPFSSAHNRRLTWDVLLRQTSDWEGSLWGKPDWADRPDRDSTQWLNRKRNEPGLVYEYNDVRVNALALALTHVWRKPLPVVLKDRVMDPIGASSTWRWYGYQNSWIVLDGLPVQSVSGGGHWGGGMFINAWDMARFGLLTLRDGKWKGKQLLSREWLREATTPTAAQPTYGHMNFFLNTDRKYYPSAPASAFVHVGNGTNIIYVDREHDLVVVARWIENRQIDELIKKILEALK